MSHLTGTLRVNPHPETLKPGQRVTTDFPKARRGRPYTITRLERSQDCVSGILAHVTGLPLPLDAAWLIPEEGKNP
ncbi:MAG TPA: hypothetical protein VHN99_06605 [Deinococcales bacterium]|nr:hypothetical protein [Deinococcales bacterium]